MEGPFAVRTPGFEVLLFTYVAHRLNQFGSKPQLPTTESIRAHPRLYLPGLQMLWAKKYNKGEPV